MRVGFAEVELRAQVKQTGGKWNRSRKVWELRYDHVVGLTLEARIVEGKASNSRIPTLRDEASICGCPGGPYI